MACVSATQPNGIGFYGLLSPNIIIGLEYILTVFVKYRKYAALMVREGNIGLDSTVLLSDNYNSTVKIIELAGSPVLDDFLIIAGIESGYGVETV